MGGVERGERNVSLENICIIAKGLGVSPSGLLAFGESAPFNSGSVPNQTKL